MQEIIQKEKLEAVMKATIKQLEEIDYLLEKGEISEPEAEFQQQIILDVLELQAEVPIEKSGPGSFACA